jgi:predicted CoA-binding protein
MKAPLSRLFDPKSIAIVGASTAPEKPGYQMVRSFETFPGRIHPVNPRGGEIRGFKVYPSLSDIPEPVDLIAMVVPPQASADVLREAAACGAGAALWFRRVFRNRRRRSQTSGGNSQNLPRWRHSAARSEFVGFHAPGEETVLHVPAGAGECPDHCR